MKILVLDGAMGTTLESLGHDVSSSDMWGCELVDKDPSVIQDVHRKYAEAGADLVETATYQLTLPALVNAGYTSSAGQAVMRKAVELAGTTKAGTVLSLGPFGATLSPGQEYAGFYPPPYGPGGYGSSTNYAAETRGYEDALTAWHLSRLEIYAADDCWDHISWLAFETCPLVAEMRAIRRAVGALPRNKFKPFWIATAFPNGKPGQLGCNGAPVPVSAVVDGLVGDSSLPVPNGIGINCTNPAYVAIIASEMSAAIDAHALRVPPWFVLYPDGGSVYDVVSRTWDDDARMMPEEWAKSVLKVARDVVASGHFEGAIVGGCCKSSFAEIEALRRGVDGERSESA